MWTRPQHEFRFAASFLNMHLTRPFHGSSSEWLPTSDWVYMESASHSLSCTVQTTFRSRQSGSQEISAYINRPLMKRVPPIRTEGRITDTSGAMLPRAFRDLAKSRNNSFLSFSCLSCFSNHGVRWMAALTRFGRSWR